MNLCRLVAGILLSAVLAVPGLSRAAHPLITDDAGTMGKGKFQLEFNAQYDLDKEDVGGVSVKTTRGEVAITLSYGIVENVDLVLSLPYLWGKIEEDESITYNEKGISDMVFETKWRLWEKEGYSLAVKPGIRIPTGDDKKGLGAGEIGYQAFLIGSKEIASWSFHTNIGSVVSG
jgi:hypothetical protein